MKLPQDELLAGSRDPDGLRAILGLAETALRTWQPIWSPFLTAPLREEALDRLSSLTELRLNSAGGWPGAERQRLLISHNDAIADENVTAPLVGLEVEGNFLFDPVEPHEMRGAIEVLGIAEGALGDLWIRGDRGAQAICTTEAATTLHGRSGQVRDVEIRLETCPLDLLQLPAVRVPKRITSVEASCRLDAIASAGFGLSRAKVVQQIRHGRLRLNWTPIRQASKEIGIGDRLQLQDRGSLEIIATDRTKRERWRIVMERS